MFCRYCGSPNNDNDTYYKKCNKQINTSRDLKTENVNIDYTSVSNTGKKPVLACILSLLIVGLGQLYNGDYKKSVAMFVLAIVTGSITVGVLWFTVGIWSALDAYSVAKGKGKKW